MSVRYTTVVFGTIVLCVFVVASYFVSRSVIVNGFEAIEDDQAETDSNRAVNAINNVVNYLDNLSGDWAYWDDAYEFIQNNNESFIRSNLTAESFIKQKIAFVVFINSEGKVDWGKQVDAENKKFDALSSEMTIALIRPTPLLLDDSQKNVAKGIVVIDSIPFIVSSRRILDSEGKKLPQGICIMGRRLDNTLIEELKTTTLLDINVKVIGPDDIEAHNTQSDDFKILRKDSTAIYATRIIKDIYNVPRLALIVKDSREAMAMGLVTFRHNFMWMLATGVGVGIVFVILLEVRILRRIRLIRAQANKICQPGEKDKDIAIDGNDEISSLADNINRMLNKIRADEVFLRETLDSLQAGVVLISSEDHRIVDLNTFALKLIDLPREEVVGKVCHGLICPQELGNCPISDQHKRFDLSVRKLLVRGKAVKSILKSVRKICRDGTEMLLESFIDISDLEETKQALQFTEDKYRTLFMNTGTATILIDNDMKILLANTEFLKLSKYNQEDIESKMVFTSFFAKEECDRIVAYHSQRRVDPEYAPREYETIFVDKNRHHINAHMTVAPIPGTSFSIASILDISDRIRAEKKILHQAFHDSLTGLPNRALLLDRLEHALKIAARDNRLVGVLLLDLDRFKHVNDSFGHSCGDKLLNLVASRLMKSVRAKDTVARLGGDEFVIVVENIQSTNSLVHVANKVLSSINVPFEVDGRVLYVSASIGLTIYPRDGADCDALIKNADIAMYKSKERGKNAYSMFTSELNDLMLSKMAMETELHQALGERKFFIVYQPKVNAQKNEIVGCEALVRWRNYAGDMVSPMDFIPLAEEMGIIVQLDMWVLQNSCIQVKLWHSLGFPELTLAVNLSAKSLQAESLIQDIAGILEKTSFPPHLLEIEITETALMSNWNRVFESINFFMRMGIRISLDDFGTGYSSLSRLQELSINTLKIDKSFVDGIGRSEGDTSALVKTIINLAGSLGLTTVAEGVENDMQLYFLMDNSCYLIQGYLYSPPLSADKFEALLGNPLYLEEISRDS